MRPGGPPARRPGRPRPPAANPAAPSPAMAAAMSGAVDLAAVKARSDAEARAATAPPPSAGRGAVAVTLDTLQSEVLDRSFQVPVLLLVVSTRLPESLGFTPTLDALAQQSGGAWTLAVLDIDQAPEIAQSLQVQAVPATFVVIKGQPIPGFEGPLPEPQLREFITSVLQAGAQAGLTPVAPGAPEDEGGAATEPETPSDPRFDAADQALQDGDFDEAERGYNEILAAEPANADAKTALLQVGLLRRLSALPADAIERAEADPNDLEAALAAADSALAANRVDDALARLLAAFRRFSGDDRDAVRSRLVEYFEILGPDDPRVPPARRQLAAALF